MKISTGNHPSFDNLMVALLNIEGYKATAILTNDGEALNDTTPPGMTGKFGAWIEVFNNLFDLICNLSETSGVSRLPAGVDAQRRGDHGHLQRRAILPSWPPTAGVHDHRGNEALVHQKLDELMPPLMRHLTMNPDTLVCLHLKDTRSAAVKGREYHEQ